MRDIRRLNNLYNEIRNEHEKHPDLRFTQLMITFMEWHESKYGNDGFYLEDDIFLIRFKEFIGKMEKVKWKG